MCKCFKKPKGKESFEIPKVPMSKNDFTDFELDILELVNYHRREKGLRMCEFSMELLNIARPHTLYMIEINSANHDNFPIRNAQAVENCNAKWLGECVGYGYGTARGFVQGWLKSAGHREIIESGKAKKFAISLGFNIKKRPYATLLFIDN